MKTIWYAGLETRDYEFQATGDTRENAIKALRLCWETHAEYFAKHGVTVTPFDEFLEEEGSGLRIEERALNQGYRDNEVLGPAVGSSLAEREPLNPDELQLHQLHDILKAAERARADFAKYGELGCQNPYPAGAQFKAWHMTYMMLTNPGMRPY